MFWIGLFLGVAIGLAAMWAVHKDISVKWYEWILGAVTIVLLIITVQHYFGSLNEFEPKAAWMGALILGLLAIVFGAVTFQLVWRRNRAG